MAFANKFSVGFFCLVFILTACGSEEKTESEQVEPTIVKSPWQKKEILTLSESGLLSTNVRAVADIYSNTLVHLVYLVQANPLQDDADNPPIEYILRHSIWDSRTENGDGIANGEIISSEDIVTLDNSLEFDFTIDANNNLYVSYRGGNDADCNSQQSDTMLAVKMYGDNQWREYTAAIGDASRRNPAYQDGDAGDYPTLAVDNNGDVHVAFQFFWEGCDSNNALHPDLLYVMKSAGAFNTLNNTDEEQVEGNDYGGTNYQNSVGFHNSLVLDEDDEPVIFHAADHTNGNEHGLRVSRRMNGQWQTSWVDKGCYISDVSAALSPQGELAVAYAINDCTEHLSYTEDDGYALRYAIYKEDAWQVQTIDEATKSGRYTQLTFDQYGDPAIAYYETESYGVGGQRELFNLKLAYFDAQNNNWFKQRVDEVGDIGIYNSLWFDTDNKPNIVSYSTSKHSIYFYSTTDNIRGEREQAD